MNKRGYTLIELLAVIMILAALALVVMPTMNNVVNGARYSSAQQSALNYIKAVDNTILQNKTGTNRIYDGTYTVADLTNYGVSVSGAQPLSTGAVKVVNEKVDSYKIVINGYTFEKGETLTDTTKPTIDKVDPDPAKLTSYVTSLEVTVTAHDNTGGMGLQISAYSFDGGATWQQSNKKTFYDNGTYKIEVRDNANNIETQDYVISKISSSTPTITIKGVATGSNFITVEATVPPDQVGIAKMEYTIDNGATWIADGINTTHTFGGLNKQTQYKVKARVTSKNGKTATSDEIAMVTSDIALPIYSISTGDWAQSKNVTITYPSMSGQSMVYYYSVDKGTTWIKASQNQQVTFNANGSLIAKATDSTNEVVASTFDVTNIDTTAPLIASVDGNSTTWTTSVTLVVSAADETGGSGLQINAYSFDGGTTWQQSNMNTFNANGTYTIKVRDNANNISTKTVVVDKISTASPTISIATLTIGSSDIVVKATTTSSEMGIASIEYSSDNGMNWTADGTNTTHTYGGLTRLTKYILRAKITDKNGKYAYADAVDATTKDIDVPTYKISATGWTQSKVVTITYPTMEGQSIFYSYSLDKGTTWISAAAQQDVTFTANGTIVAKATDNTNTTTATTYTVTDVDSIAPVIASVTGDPTVWSTSATIEVNASDEKDGSGLQSDAYSFDSGTTWGNSKTSIVTSNGTYTIKVRDNANNIASKQITITKVSTTTPTITLATKQVGSNYITTTATITDNEMGTAKIEYSIDNGTTWLADGTNDTHTFGGLTKNTTYKVLARVTSNNGKTATSNLLAATTSDITTPTYAISSTDWATTKDVTITYPTIAGQTLIYTYSLDKGTTWITATQVQKVTFTAVGTIVARVSDLNNTVNANTYTVTKIYYYDYVLNGADPVLDAGMIPVSIANDGTVTKADQSAAWYNYTNKLWANAVLVSSDVRSTYQSAVAGTSIDTSKILAYYVWIPRYKYALFNPDGTAGTTASTIDVVFENKSTAKSAGTTVGTYLTHPAFTFGTTELNGIWVGKFEMTGTQTNPTILPNVSSLRSLNVSTFFSTIQGMKSTTYGATSDSHMMMNKEWGAVAYLTQSIYGKNSEARINNNGNFITGCGAAADNGASTIDCEIAYGYKVTNYPQSTNGNISGIFDMNGGAWEYVMGTYNSTIDSSGFSTLPDSKYYQSYTDLTSSPLGDALKETQGWHGDSAFFVYPFVSWFVRGGNCNNADYSGMFSFGSKHGDADNSYSARAVVAPGA